MPKKQWTVTADKFLHEEEIVATLETLQRCITNSKDALSRSRSLRDYYMFRILLETGLRIHEFLLLKDADLIKNKLIVHAGKGGKPRTIILTPDTNLCLQKWLKVRSSIISTPTPLHLFPKRDGTRLTTRALQKRVTRVFEMAGLPRHLSAHNLRHTYASLLILAGVPLTTVRSNLGHSSLRITDLYAHSCLRTIDIDLYQTELQVSA